ncbi:helix-turn-helix transcriptional regulator [Lysobacter sp. CA196]|uniref:helix-turn-helix transcriptional regulator n=1 Tax=Lysobacter sp. CA196 TaxID=3455606 RepID=UPI003F8D8254
MAALPERIRRARALSRTSQLALAQAVGVQRSAVAQWERSNGSRPSMLHLVAIAMATGVCLEWLGTGRGQVRPNEDAWTPAMRPGDYAQDEIEEECLVSLRQLPFQLRKQLVTTISLMAKMSSPAEPKRAVPRALTPSNDEGTNHPGNEEVDNSAMERHLVAR